MDELSIPISARAQDGDGGVMVKHSGKAGPKTPVILAAILRLPRSNPISCTCPFSSSDLLQTPSLFLQAPTFNYLPLSYTIKGTARFTIFNVKPPNEWKS